MATTTEQGCLYHSKRGRNLLEHSTNLLRQHSLFPPSLHPYLRRATCSCPRSPDLFPEMLLPFSEADDVIPPGFPAPLMPLLELLAAAGKGEKGEKEGEKEAAEEELKRGKERLRRVILRLGGKKENPYGFSETFFGWEREQERRKGKVPPPPSLSRLMPLPKELVPTFIGKGGQNLKTLNLPKKISVHVEDGLPRPARSGRSHSSSSSSSSSSSFSSTSSSTPSSSPPAIPDGHVLIELKINTKTKIKVPRKSKLQPSKEVEWELEKQKKQREQKKKDLALRSLEEWKEERKEEQEMLLAAMKVLEGQISLLCLSWVQREREEEERKRRIEEEKRVALELRRKRAKERFEEKRKWQVEEEEERSKKRKEEQIPNKPVHIRF